MLTPEQLRDIGIWKSPADIPALLQHIDEQAEQIRELEADGERLSVLQSLVLDGAEVLIGDEWTPPRIFIQKEGCGGPDYVYHGDGDLRAAIDAARSEVPRG